ncbi:MAG: hypothetical protein ABIP38_09440 [Steroidobacteraceae bacterium]
MHRTGIVATLVVAAMLGGCDSSFGRGADVAADVATTGSQQG